MTSENAETSNNSRQYNPEELHQIKEQVVAAISTIFDPEIPVNIYELGLIYEVQVLPMGKIWVQMTLTSPACPVGPQIMGAVHSTALQIEGVEEVEIELVWNPPWDPRTMATEDVRMMLGIWD